MKIAISAESTIDLPKELLKDYEISIIPFTVILGDKEGLDGEITPDEIFDYVSKTNVLPKTAAINEYQYGQYFSKLLETYDYVIHFSLSSKISSSCSNAIKASEEFNGKVFIIDSLSLLTLLSLKNMVLYDI